MLPVTVISHLALGHVTTYDDYDANGRPGTVTDPNGVVTSFTYDLLGRVETITAEHPGNPSLNAVTTMAYDEVGNVIELTLPSTDTLLMDYDSANRLVAMRAASGERWDYAYDKMGNVTSETVKRGNGTVAMRTTNKFDELGRLIRSTAGTAAGAQPAKLSYDKAHNITGTITPNGHETTSAFDALNRLISTVAPDGGETGFDYDARGNLADFTDPVEVTTGFVYNGFGDLIQETSPDRGTSTYVYDAAGNVIEATDGRGQTIEYTRDFLGRVTEMVPTGLPAETVTYTWDSGGLSGSYAIGRLAKVEDASGTTEFQYDHRGNLLAQQQTIGSTSGAQLAYTYDTADRITQIAYPSGRLVKYSYDSKGRVSAVETKAQSSDPGWTLVANGYSYDPFGPMTAMALGNGLAVQKTYGTDGLLTSSRLYDSSTSTSLAHLAYRHDANGNIGAITDLLDDANSVLFGYDSMDRLQLAVAPNGGTPASYSYTSGTNQLASVTDGSGTRTIAYDDRGNTESETRPGSVTLSTAYDGYGRLTEYDRSDLGDPAEFVYNGLDDRVTMALPTGRYELTTIFVAFARIIWRLTTARKVEFLTNIFTSESRRNNDEEVARAVFCRIPSGLCPAFYARLGAMHGSQRPDQRPGGRCDPGDGQFRGGGRMRGRGGYPERFAPDGRDRGLYGRPDHHQRRPDRRCHHFRRDCHHPDGHRRHGRQLCQSLHHRGQQRPDYGGLERFTYGRQPQRGAGLFLGVVFDHRER